MAEAQAAIKEKPEKDVDSEDFDTSSDEEAEPPTSVKKEITQVIE